jgi:hypothetical protein
VHSLYIADLPGTDHCSVSNPLEVNIWKRIPIIFIVGHIAGSFVDNMLGKSK